MSIVIPKTGIMGRWLNPHEFNSKEHLAIVIMSGSASGAAYATEVLATQKLYYNIIPNPVVAILLLFSSQLMGYGMAGVLRKSLVYPTKMIWPSILPLSSLIETLHRDKEEMKKKWNFFWIIFAAVAVWEWFPQYIAPFLTGVSFFCLANRKSLVFTNIFGGSSGNEGLGLMALSFDWQYIGISSFYLPLQTLCNAFLGFVICTAMYIGLYYSNVWNAQNFPFLSQSLFSNKSNSTLFDVYNQTLILDAKNELNVAALDTVGLPFFATTNAAYLLTTNLGITATIVHMLLWELPILRESFTMPKWSSIKNFNLKFSQRKTAEGDIKLEEKSTADMDPHYKQMLAYKEVPSYWYLTVMLGSIIVGMFCIYNLKSTLPWWGFLIAILLSFLSTLFFGALTGLIGFQVPITSVIQLIGGYLHPGKPVANMYFVLFGANSQTQALFLVENLKLGQYGKLSPRCTFTVQIIGTVFGAIINYALMSSITTNQREILLSIQGTNIWSGQVIQSFNSNVSLGHLFVLDTVLTSSYRPSHLALSPNTCLVLAAPTNGLFSPFPSASHSLCPSTSPINTHPKPALTTSLPPLSAGISATFLLESTPPSWRTSLSASSSNSTCASATQSGSSNTTISLQPPLVEALNS